MEMGTDSLKRPAPIRRPTTLQYEGDFSAATESANYHAFPGLHRSELRRRGTSLRMEGEFTGRTESDDKFVEWPAESRRRPEPIRLPGQLRLEGDLETSTECHDKYVPFVGARRPDILRQASQLKIEGDSSWTPEYTDVFREHDFVERRSPKIPESTLRTGGGFFDKTETSDLFRDPRDKEAELMAELAKDAEEEEEKKKRREEEENRLKKEEEMRLLVSKLEDLKGPPLEIPEYKDAYKDFPRERPKLMKPEDEIGRADGSKAPASPSRFRTKIDQDPEYKSIFLDPSKDQNRPIFHRPPLSLRPSAASSRNSLYNNSNYYRRDSRRSEAPLVSEIRSQYVNYGQQPRAESQRIPTSLRLEGDLDLEPEYRNAYCAQPRGSILQEPASRRRERSNSASRRRDSVGNNNYWINNDNGEHFGTVNAADDQDAFQVLQTRVHEESVVGKPPPGSRRRSSLIRQPPDITLTPAEHRPPAGLRKRSSSPNYRLQVSHVEDEPKGFVSRGRHRRRSPSQSLLVQPTNERRSPSPIEAMSERPYSPSFARENSAATRQQQAFVVLDNNNAEDGPLRRRRTDRNYDPRDSLASVRASNGNAIRLRNRTPPNWMPPWYDSSTSTI